MGRHSMAQKRVKRRNRKRSKRQRYQSIVKDNKIEETLSTSSSDHELVHVPVNTNANGSALTSETMVPMPSEIGEASDDTNAYGSALTSETMVPIPSEKEASDDEDDSLFAGLDRVEEDSDVYWNKLADEKIKEYDSYHDAHPCIVEDEQRSFRVYVDGTGPYKGTAGLKRVAMEVYVGRLMKKEAKATELCRSMRDRIESLEDALRDSKVKMMKMHRESQRKIEKVRYFWRNKIFEGNSRGGELLKAALIYPDTYS